MPDGISFDLIQTREDDRSQLIGQLVGVQEGPNAITQRQGLPRAGRVSGQYPH